MLRDPRTGSSHYVGETDGTIEGRLGWHLMAALTTDFQTQKNPEKDQWVRDLVALGLSPTVHLLEEFPSVDDVKVDKKARLSAERRWMAKLRAEGHVLFNKVSGTKKGHIFAEGTGARKLKGRKRPELAAKLLGKEMPTVTHKALSKSRAERWAAYRNLSEEERARDHEERAEAAKRAWTTRRARKSQT